MVTQSDRRQYGTPFAARGRFVISREFMRSFQFVTVDVFTELHFGGNPLAVFPDAEGKLNLSVLDMASLKRSPGLLIVPNFTVAGDANKGRRPSFDRAMRPEQAGTLFARLIDLTKAAAGSGVQVAAGVFRAHMQVDIQNDGPITLVLQSPS